MRTVRFLVHTRQRAIVTTLALTAVLTCAAGCSQTANPSRDGIEEMPIADSKPSAVSPAAPAESSMSPTTTPDSASSTPPQSTNATAVRPTPKPIPVTQPGVELKSAAKRVEFAPHIVIDWSIPRVEIAAEVALSDGLIELLLCGRGTKEHESILVTDASAQRMFEAMGLIGLTPGSPVQYDEATESFLPPRGDRVNIEIEYNNRVDGAHQWMRETKTSASADPINWVFAGSRDIAGQFGANGDGTIVCVVNFDTALIAPDTLHTADNSALWLAANEQRVPAAGTQCRVFIRSATDTSDNSNAITDSDADDTDSGEADADHSDTGPMRLIVTPEGNFHWGNELLTPVELDGVIRERIERNPDQPVHLTAIPGTDARLARVAARCIVGSGIKQSNLTLELPDEGDSGSSETTGE